ncbi:MAG: hypothetical protein ACRDD1_02880 [Planctomycetia bacterium]
MPHNPPPEPDPLSDEEESRLDDYRFMMGPHAGALALVLDQLTDVMAMVNQHTVYCRVERGPRAGEPPHDVAEAVALLARTKRLVQRTLRDLRADVPT